MPRIKQLLADGKFVRMFGVGQLFSPKLIEVIAEHGALRRDLARRRARRPRYEGYRTRHDGGDAYDWIHFVRLPATDYASIMRAGSRAGGVMVSMIQGPEDAEKAVALGEVPPCAASAA